MSFVLNVRSIGTARNYLSWSPVAGATGYVIYRGMSTSGSIAGKSAIISNAGATTLADNNVTLGVKYFYLVVATFMDGTIQSSNEVAITTI